MALEALDLSARLSAGYKGTLVPRRFSNDSLLPFSPLTFLYGPGRLQDSTSSTSPTSYVPKERYDATGVGNALA